MSKPDTRNSKLPLDGFGHPAGAKAAGADPDAAGGPFLEGVDPLKVGIPSPLGLDVGMAYLVTYLGALAANFTRPGHRTPPFPKTNRRDPPCSENFIAHPRSFGNPFCFPLLSRPGTYPSKIVGGGLIWNASGALGAPRARTRRPRISSRPSAYIWMAWE